MHTLLADEAVCIGPAKSTESYLNMSAVLSAAVLIGAEAIHPGFGFLVKTQNLRPCVRKWALNLLVPSAKVMDLMGIRLMLVNR